MKYYNFLKISPGNEALQFLNRRVNDDKYRGVHLSQHNRYEMNDALVILTKLDRYAPNKSRLTIRTTDLSKRPNPNPDEIEYTNFCEECSGEVKKATVDAMRKNFFVDFHRMGLIARFNKKGTEVGPYQGGAKKYVALTDLGLEFVNERDLIRRYFIYTGCIRELLHDEMIKLLDILKNAEGIDSISLYDYMFFISAIGSETGFKIRTEQAVQLIKDFGNLSPIQIKRILLSMRDELVPKKHLKNKPDQRDFHNWENEMVQIFHLLSQTIFFDIRKENTYKNRILRLKERLHVKSDIMLPLRSMEEKRNYFRNHRIDKKTGFEIHHVVPLLLAGSIEEFQLLDNWRNMAYIDGYSHAKISQGGNKKIIMKSDAEDIVLKDEVDKKITLKKDGNIIYDVKNQNKMIEYNGDLLHSDKRTAKKS